MFRTRMQAGIVAAGLLVVCSSLVRASTPSDECRDGAAHCREAFDKLERCEGAKESPKDTVKEAARDGGTDSTKADAKADKKAEPAKDSCGVERAAADSACKMTNESCVRDGSSRSPPPRKD